MASTSATNLISDRSRYDQKKQRANTPTLPSPEQTDRSDTESASASASAFEDDTDRETINKAFDVIYDNFIGLSTSTKAYSLFHFETSSSFQYLQERFKDFAGLSQFVDDKVRLDWNADTGDLLLRLMPTFIHDYFQDAVSDALKAELNRIAENPELAPFRNQLLSGSTADIKKEENGINAFRKSPDGQYIAAGTTEPIFILEIAFSQSERAVLEKVDEYFLKLSSCTILTFDLDYVPRQQTRVKKRVHDGSVSLATLDSTYKKGEPWGHVTEILDADLFRKAGQAVAGRVEIPFWLFVPSEQRKDLPESANAASVRLDFAHLAQILDTAEKQQHALDNAPPPPTKSKKGLSWKRKNGEVEEILAPEPKRHRTRQSTREQRRLGGRGQ